MKLMTLDIEGDCSIKDNIKLFPEGNHFDPDTIPWCCTVVAESRAMSLVCKLPPKPRTRIDGSKTRCYHEDSTVIPNGLYRFTHESINYESIVYPFDRREDLIRAIHKLCSLADRIYIKPYFQYLYDRDLLKIQFNKYVLSDESLNKFIPHHCWINSYSQRNPICNNQTFLENRTEAQHSRHSQTLQ